MKGLTQLTDTLFTVEVPADAKDIRAGNVNEQVAFLDYDDNLIPLPSGNWKYLGYATASEISFDVEDEIEECGKKVAYNRYNNFNGEVPVGTAKESLYSLLSSKGLYWINTYGEKEPILKYSDYEFGNDGLSESMELSINSHHNLSVIMWQQAEQNKILGKLVFIKLLK